MTEYFRKNSVKCSVFKLELQQNAVNSARLMRQMIFSNAGCNSGYEIKLPKPVSDEY